MPVKTRDGWKTLKQINAQDKAWERSRSKLVEKISQGDPANLKDDGLIKRRAIEVFAEIDTDGNKKIDPAELKAALTKLGVVGLTSKEADAMVREADADGDHLIDEEEFIDLVIAEVKRWINTRPGSCACIVS